jgi:hypothetical protein
MAKTRPAKSKRSPSGPKAPALKVRVQHDIDQALATARIPAAVDSDGWRWMQEPSGKALIGVAAVVGRGEDLSLRVVAPIMPLPEAPAALMRILKKIAETNYDVPGHSRLAIDSRTVWSVVAHSVADISPEDVPNCIFDCLWLAQAAADVLKGKGKKAARR